MIHPTILGPGPEGRPIQRQEGTPIRHGISLRLRIMAAIAVGLTAVTTLLGIWWVQVLQESKQRLL